MIIAFFHADEIPIWIVWGNVDMHPTDFLKTTRMTIYYSKSMSVLLFIVSFIHSLQGQEKKRDVVSRETLAQQNITDNKQTKNRQ